MLAQRWMAVGNNLMYGTRRVSFDSGGIGVDCKGYEHLLMERTIGLLDRGVLIAKAINMLDRMRLRANINRIKNRKRMSFPLALLKLALPDDYATDTASDQSLSCVRGRRAQLENIQNKQGYLPVAMFRDRSNCIQKRRKIKAEGSKENPIVPKIRGSRDEKDNNGKRNIH